MIMYIIEDMSSWIIDHVCIYIYMCVYELFTCFLVFQQGTDQFLIPIERWNSSRPRLRGSRASKGRFVEQEAKIEA